MVLHHIKSSTFEIMTLIMTLKYHNIIYHDVQSYFEKSQSDISESLISAYRTHIRQALLWRYIKLSVKYGNEWLVSAQDLNGHEKQIFFFYIVILLRE